MLFDKQWVKLLFYLKLLKFPIVYLPNEMYKTGKESAPNNVIFELLFVITRKLFVDFSVMLVFGNATTI